MRTRATEWLAGATALAQLMLMLGGSRTVEAAAVAGGLIPARFTLGLAIGGAVPPLLTPLTSLFIHEGWLHLGMNMLMLVFIGRFVEVAIGPGRLLLLYAVGGFAAAGAQLLADPTSQVPVIGASGAISALLGGYAILYGTKRPRAGRFLSAETLNALWLAAAWIGLQLLTALAFNDGRGGIAIWSHAGGFIAGLLLVRPLLRSRYRAG